MALSKKEILDELNEEQRIAVINYIGTQYLVAGPGSGKTRVLVDRIAYMILSGLNPYSILAFTFTNKAAREIKHRIATTIDSDSATKITTGTYHSFCCRILRKYGDKLNYENGWSIFDSEDSTKLITKITNGYDIKPNMVKSYISSMKRKMITPFQATMNADESTKDLANLYLRYQASLFKQQGMDFDDLIHNTIKLLRKFPEIQEQVSKRYRYIIVDESHDSSESDIELIRLLTGENKNVCFILDDAQSIYSFRGANLQAVLNIKDIFPDIKTYYLNQNYRSSGVIVNASKSLINHNSRQLKKDIFTNNKEGNRIVLLEEKNATFEAMRIANVIKSIKDKYNYNYKDIAILYRTSSLSREIEDIFLKYGIPYEILSGVNFYSRKEIKDLVSYINFICNPRNTEAFERIVNIPKKGVGDKAIETIYKCCNDGVPLDIVEGCKAALNNNVLKGNAKNGIALFINTMDLLIKEKDNYTVSEFLEYVIKITGYYKYLQDNYSEDYTERKDNINELLELAHDFNSLEEFLEQTSLDRPDSGEEEDKVQLLTMHMSKGLEWKTVFIVGANEGTIPHFRSLSIPSQIEEERRIMYVAITRAKENLFICRPLAIKVRGNLQAKNRSRFIDEINKDYIYDPKEMSKG